MSKLSMSKQSTSKQWWKLIGVIGIAIMVASCGRESRDSPPTAAVNASPSPLPAPKSVRMTQFQQINGTPYFYAPIYISEQEERNIVSRIKSGSYEDGKYGGSSDIRNYMFVHRDNLSASKLLPNNNSRLLDLEQIGESVPVAKDPSRGNWIKNVKTLWYVQVLADTNGNKAFDSQDRKQIAISDVSGANYTQVIKDIDTILLVYPKGLDRRLVFYTSANKHFVADVDITNRQATIKELPAIK
jgi:hypothetical protein